MFYVTDMMTQACKLCIGYLVIKNVVMKFSSLFLEFTTDRISKILLLQTKCKCNCGVIYFKEFVHFKVPLRKHKICYSPFARSKS